MSIMPLPQFEADLEAARKDAEEYARLSIPKTLVVRFGLMKLVGEYPYDGEIKPGCGSKIVIRTHRGTEIGEMLTSTCPNAGCSKSVSRKEMLEFIENSGGKDYPFFTEGRALRVATIQDMNEQSRIDSLRPAMIKVARQCVEEVRLPIKVLDAEPILGGERLTFYFASEDRIDFRDLVSLLSREYATRIELRQVGARDEARLVADYEKCGQHCCCKQFLKVLKPVSIKSAKTQKATLDPLKISGRCGRLMCCLRYEDQTYDELVKRLPKMKKRVGTPHGIGVVVDRQILTQLVLVKLEHDFTEVAVAAEDICTPEEAPPPGAAAKASDPLRGMAPEQVERRVHPAGPDAPQDAAQSRGDPGRRGGQSGEPKDRQQSFRDRGRNEPRSRPPNQPAGPDVDRPTPPRPQQGQPTQGEPRQDDRAGQGGQQQNRRRRRGGGGGSGSGGGASGPRPDGNPSGTRPNQPDGSGSSSRPPRAEGPSQPPADRGPRPPQGSGDGGGPLGEARRRRRRRKGGPFGGGAGGGGGPFGPG